LPKDIFYEFETLKPVQGKGTTISLTNVGFTSIPLHIKGGSIVPLRVSSAMTTTALREKDFELIIALDARGQATGSLYIDDGISIKSKSTSISMSFSRGRLFVAGSFGYNAGVSVTRVRILGVPKKPNGVKVDGKAKQSSHNADTQVLDVELGLALNKGFSVDLA
jgi:alpha-glucosidase